MAVKTLPSNLPSSGLLSARPTSTGSKSLYYATDVASGTLFVDTSAGWKAATGTLLDDPVYATHNFTPLSLRYARAALAKLRSGTADLRFTSKGDSVTAGTGTTAALTDHYTRRAAKILAAKLGVVARRGFVDIYPEPARTLDPQWTLGGAWSFYSGAAGGALSTAAASSANAATFTPTDDDGVSIQGDQFYVYIHDASSTAQYAIDGGSYSAIPASVDTQTGVRRHTIPAMTRGTHTLSIKSGAGGAVYLAGAELVDSQVRGVRYWGYGTGGSATPSGALDQEWTRGQAFRPDVWLCEWGINEYAGQVALATFSTNVQNVVTRLKAVPQYPFDIMWMGSAPQNSSLTIPQQSYNDTLDAAAEAASIPVLHIDRQFGTYAAAFAAPLSLMSADGIHPNTAGANQIGAAIASLLSIL